MSLIDAIAASTGGMSGLVPTGGGLTGDGTLAVRGLGSEVGGAPAVDASANGFAGILTRSIDNLENLHSTADNLAVQAATGDLTDVHDYTLAASKAQLMTELVVAVRNKGIDAFTEIMRMPL